MSIQKVIFAPKKCQPLSMSREVNRVEVEYIYSVPWELKKSMKFAED